MFEQLGRRGRLTFLFRGECDQVPMSCQKRKGDREENARGPPNAAKRALLAEDSSSCNKKLAQQAAGKSVRTYSDGERSRLLEILEAEFDKELQAKEDEIIEIQERILKTQRILQCLCYAVVSDFYSREKTISSVVSTRQRRIHPAVKKLLSGKGPPGAPEHPQNISTAGDTSCTSSSYDAKDNDVLSRADSPLSVEGLSEQEKKVPRYIPPKPKTKPNVGIRSEPVRGGQNKIKTILVVGNVSKWFPPDTREDAASHKWMVYVRGPKDAPDISSFVSKVRFFLHPSYRPNDVVQVVCPPFQLSRRGWGEFPIRVQVHFHNTLNKPVDIIHNLKLDRTYSGLQTLGAETVAEVWIRREKLPSEIFPEQKSNFEQHKVKEEHIENNEKSSAHEFQKRETVPLVSGSTIDRETESNNQISPQNEKIVSKVLPVKLSGVERKQAIDNSMLQRLPVKVEDSSDVTLQVDSVDISSTHISEKSCMEKEFLFENEHPKIAILSPATTVATNETVKKPSSSILVSPQKVSSHSLSSSALVQKAAQSPIKVETVNPETHVPVTKKIQITPPKPGTQFVKCIDSQGNVRLLQVRSDLFAKNLRGGTSALPTTATATQGGTVKAIVNSSVASVQPLPQTSVLAKAPGLHSGLPVSQRTPTPGAKQVLRFVRPVGETNVRPLLVATNSGSQPRVGVTVPQAGNGNRPLLVLKDGKLFMMKSALGTSGINAAVSASKLVPLSNANVQTGMSLLSNQATEQKSTVLVKGCESMKIISNSLSKTMVAGSTTATKLTSVITSPLPSTGSTISSKDLVTENVCRPQAVILTPGETFKPQSFTSNPPVPKPIVSNEPTVQNMSKSNIGLTQHMPTAQRIPTPSSASKIIVKPGKSLLKSAVSVLKSNVGSTQSPSKVSLLQPATAQPPSLLKVQSSTSCLVSPPAIIGVPTTSTTTVKRVILGRTSGSSSVTTTSQQALAYRERLGMVLKACPKSSLKNVWRAVRWLVKNLPLVNSEAKFPEFRILYPYCAPDEKTFCSWNIGKQRACEWLRAKTIRSLLRDAGWDLQSIWTTREIVLWARFHGYTPGLPAEDSNSTQSSSCDGDHSNSSICQYGEMAMVAEWLSAQENFSDSSSRLCGPLPDVGSEESDDEIDVVSSIISPSKIKIKQENLNLVVNTPPNVMPLEINLHPVGDLITSSLNRYGLHLSSEEIVPGVQYPAALRVLVQAVQSLAEDLARRAVADAWGKNVSRRPASIEIQNVCGAICHRPELDIFTCAGLGIKSPEDSFAVSGNGGRSKTQSSAKHSKANKI